MEKIGSASFRLSTEETKSIARGAGIAIAGAILTAIAGITVPTLDITADTQTLITVVILSVIVNTARKLVPDTRK